MVAPRIELSATRVSGGFGRPALDYHVVVSKSRTPRSRTESLLVPNQACFHLHLYPMSCCFNRRSVCCRRISSLSVGREALESSSAVLQTAARPSQLPAQIGFVFGLPVRCGHEKRPDVCVTSGLDERRFERSRRHMRKRYAGVSLFDGVPPKRLPSRICSSRLGWNFDNMELSARL